jgi:hypothetical protein
VDTKKVVNIIIFGGVQMGKKRRRFAKEFKLEAVRLIVVEGRRIPEVARELALHSTSAQCAIIGSSHIMKISSHGEKTFLSDSCSTLINLGVTAASLEDCLALSETILQNKNPPKIIVFRIDSRALNFNRDARWKRYSEKDQTHSSADLIIS